MQVRHGGFSVDNVLNWCTLSRMAFVYNVTREVWECGGCGWQWIPRNKSVVPTQCPNRGCRERLVFGKKRGVGVSGKSSKAIVSVKVGEDEIVQPAPQDQSISRPTLRVTSAEECDGGSSQRSRGGARRSGSNKLSAEEFVKLSNSDKLKAPDCSSIRIRSRLNGSILFFASCSVDLSR